MSHPVPGHDYSEPTYPSDSPHKDNPGGSTPRPKKKKRHNGGGLLGKLDRQIADYKKSSPIPLHGHGAGRKFSLTGKHRSPKTSAMNKKIGSILDTFHKTDHEKDPEYKKKVRKMEGRADD